MNRTSLFFLAATALLTLACGNTIEVDPGEGGSDDPGTTSTTTTTTTTTSTGAGEGGGAEGGGGQGQGGGDPVQSDVCARLQSVFISGMQVVDASGDGVWSPGELASFEVTLWNYSNEFNSDYPGVEISSSHPYAQPTMGSIDYLFGLEPGGQATLSFELQAMDFVPPGEVVFLDARVVSLVEPCEGTDYNYTTVSLELPVVVD
jgi:hypothetical protein